MTEHLWERTSDVPRQGDAITFHTYRCRTCGVTGRRYGAHPMTLDNPFKQKGFKTCAGARRLLAAQRDREARRTDRCEL